MLQHIHNVAVRGLHKEVHRLNFSKLHQKDGESITHYVARLKAQATLCSFTVQCSCQQSVCYAEDMVSQQLVTGLQKQDHQSKVLSEATTLTSLDRKVARLQSLESTEDTASRLQAPVEETAHASGTIAMKTSQYKQRKVDSSVRTYDNHPRRNQTTTTRKCRGCGGYHTQGSP